MFVIANPWGLLAGAAVPVLVAIHFYRRRFRPKDVAGLFLWPQAAHFPPAGRTRSRLETPLTLLLEILAALLLTALVSGARWEERTSSPHLIVVLDHSASMAARAPSGERFADRALRAVRNACEEQGPLGAVRLTVILTGPRPVVAVGPAAPAERGLEELKAWQPLLASHSFGPALELARRFADMGGAVRLVTDHPDAAAAGKGVRVIGVGQPVANTALTAAERVREGPAGTSVFVRVAHFSGQAAERKLTLRDEAGRWLADETLRLAPGGEATALWKVPAGHALVRVRLEGEDALETDDAALLVEPGGREVRIRCDFPKESRERALIEKACRAVPDAVWLEPEDPAEPHLRIAPALGEAAWTLAIGAPPDALRAGEKLEPLVGPYFSDLGHPLMEQLDFRGVIWSGAHPLKRDAPVGVLLSAADVPLLVQVRKEAYLLNLELARSNCPKSPAWPMLFHNLAGLRRESLPGLKRWNFRPGEAVSFREKEPAGVRILDPAGKELPVVRLADAVETFDARAPGVYRIARGSETLDRFAVNFLDARESDLRRAHDAGPPELPGAGPATLEQPSRWPWLDPALCLLILALVLLDLGLARRRAAGVAA